MKFDDKLVMIKAFINDKAYLVTGLQISYRRGKILIAESMLVKQQIIKGYTKHYLYLSTKPNILI